MRVITPPASWPVSVAEIKENSRIDGTDEDTLIASLIEAATINIEDYLLKSVTTKTVEEDYSGFPEMEIEAESITSISYFDADNQSQTFEDFELHGGFLYSLDEWPEVYDRPDAVTVRYVTLGTCPETVKHAIKLLVANWYERRTGDEHPKGMTPGVRALVDRYRSFA